MKSDVQGDKTYGHGQVAGEQAWSYGFSMIASDSK